MLLLQFDNLSMFFISSDIQCRTVLIVLHIYICSVFDEVLCDIYPISLYCDN